MIPLFRKQWQASFTAHCRALAAIDLRSLALFRIGLAITVMVYLVSFWPYVDIFLHMCPHACVTAYSPGDVKWLVFDLIDMSWFVRLCMAIGMVMALALLLGYRTTVATIFCWFVVVSLNSRLEIFTYLADTLLAVLLFWSMFLPLGARFSVDNALSLPRIQTTYLVSWAGLAILLQHAYVYTMGALLKGGTWDELTAIHIAINTVPFRSGYSYLLENIPVLTGWLTQAIYYLELCTLPLLFFPWKNAVLRVVVISLLGLMHLGFAVFLNVGYFPLVSMVGLLLFIPATVWKRLTPSGSVVIYYDEECAFCKKTALIFREFSMFCDAAVLPAQDNDAMEALLRRENSWIVQTHRNQLLLKWDAVVYLWRYSPLFWPLGVLFMPKLILAAGNWMYRWIGNHRRQLGALSALMLPYRKLSLHPFPLLVKMVVLPLLCLVTYTNIHHMPRFHTLPYPLLVTQMMQLTRLNQSWVMFASPVPSSSWMVVEGRYADGQKRNLLTGKQVQASTMPNTARELYASQRWLPALMRYNWKLYGALYAGMYCQQEKGLQAIEVRRFRQPMILGQSKGSWPIKNSRLFNYSCAGPQSVAVQQ
jgi:predicted DCC family thiol-disulfide oxidoreductase YuxK